MHAQSWREADTVAGIHAQTAFHVEAVRFAVGERTLLGPVTLELQR
ncbi:MAG: Fe3+-hydroxamate ABC transporter ATP-binding protein FhuC, partial [Mesorhizobium sp.]